MTEVAAALIWDKERFLICRRPEGKTNGGLWEFPGGKAEPGETLPQALIRECREELGVTLAVGRQLAETTYPYPDRVIRLTLWEAVIAQGQPQLLEHTGSQWVAPAELPSAGAASEDSLRFFCPADRAFLDLLRREGKSPQRRIQERLFSLRDLSYRDFHSKLMPTVPLEQVIGVRVPTLRRYAKELSKTPEAALFLHCLPHFYYEENNLHGFLLEGMKDYSQAVAALERFLPHVDNWATCDMVSPKAFVLPAPKGKEPLPAPGLLEQCGKWMASSHPYTVRFGMGMLMRYFLGEAFSPRQLSMVIQTAWHWSRSFSGAPKDGFSRPELSSPSNCQGWGEYYVNMMAAWYFATALAKQYEAALPCFQQQLLPLWTHNKAIQKALESNRIPSAQKLFLRRLKRP